MPDRAHIGLDNAAFQGRLKQRTIFVQPRPVKQRFERHLKTQGLKPNTPTNQIAGPSVTTEVRQRGEYIRTAKSTPQEAAKSEPTNRKLAQLAIVKPQPYAVPASPKLQRSSVLQRQFVHPDDTGKRSSKKQSHRYSKLQMSLVGMAGFVFLVGLMVSVQTLRTNHDATAQVAALARKSAHNSDDAAVPASDKPSSGDLKNYVVAPNLARYIRIPKLDVDARVLQVGATKTGALGTPNNVFDAAWYTGSAKPGEPGAALIDGHVSSWTSKGVFYGIKNLVAGDTIQIVRGDGKVLNYKVVKTQVYSADKVDMNAAVNPVTQGKSGLNLITCDGRVEPGTSEFNQRVIVFSELE